MRPPSSVVVRKIAFVSSWLYFAPPIERYGMYAQCYWNRNRKREIQFFLSRSVFKEVCTSRT